MSNLSLLDAHVSDEGARPFIWGRRDCCLFVADWVRLATGLDPAAHWRGTYADQRSARRRLADRGGFEGAVAAEMDRLGFRRTEDPLTGDVAIVKVLVCVRRGRILEREVGAIRIGRLWAVKGRHGVAGGRFPVVAAWAIEPEIEA